MRNKFADIIFQESKKDSRICALVADISPAGSMVDFRQSFPERFINCGVAEQSMIGIAAGLAMKGMKPFCYTISTFSLYRPFEMVRVDLCYQNLPVVVIGMGAGVIYSTLGSTHHTIEDISIASSIPNMRVLAPCDPIEMGYVIKWCVTKNKGPVYIRLGKAGEPNLTNPKQKFDISKLRFHSNKSKTAIITYGTITKYSFNLKKELKKEGLSIDIITSHSLKPLDRPGIFRMLSNYDNIFVVEEHVEFGGLGAQITKIAFENNSLSRIYTYHLKDEFLHFYGSYEELLVKHGIDFKKIKRKIISLI